MGAKSKNGLTYLLSNTSFQTDHQPDLRSAIHDYDLVRTIVPVESEGHLISKGTIGTVVDTSKTSDVYEIEFVEPVCCVVTMTRDQFVRA